jgi:hypothetical protein
MTTLAGAFSAAGVVSLILLLILRELSSAHTEESGSLKAKILSHNLLIPIAPLLVAFAFVVVMKVLAVVQ